VCVNLSSSYVTNGSHCLCSYSLYTSGLVFDECFISILSLFVGRYIYLVNVPLACVKS